MKHWSQYNTLISIKYEAFPSSELSLEIQDLNGFKTWEITFRLLTVYAIPIFSFSNVETIFYNIERNIQVSTETKFSTKGNKLNNKNEINSIS